MVLDLLLFAGSALALFLALTRDGWGDLVLLAGPMALGSLGLVLWNLRRRPRGRTHRHVVIDGSNLIYWQDETAPSLVPVKAAVTVLQARGLRPGVIFDANVGYKIGDRYRDDRILARQLDLPEDRVLVVPKGVPADQYILKAARDLSAPVVTNDRYRDWAEHFPEVADPGKLIRGGWRNGDLWLDNEG